MEIRKANKTDLPQINLLNEGEVPHVTSIDTEDWLHFLEIASNFIVIDHQGEVIGFMVSLREGQDYTSINYNFFVNHFDEFEYVDRIVISKEHQNIGLGRKLYEYLFENNSTPITCCEVNVKPVNANSLAFHERLGFSEKSKMITSDGAKIVSLLVRKS
jgi:predicted GNAT superfamily acetyltransferase